MSLPLESLVIEVRPDRPREFLYTDKGGTHWFGEAAHAPSRSYHGFYSHMHEFVDGWDLEWDDRKLEHIEWARARPDQLQREYGGLQETVRLLDHAGTGGAALLVEWLPQSSGRLRLTPRIDMRFLWEETRPDYEVSWSDATQTLSIASRRHLQRTAAEDWPVWSSFALDHPWSFSGSPSDEVREYPKGQARRAMARATLFRPGTFEIECEAGRAVTLCIALGDTQDDARSRTTQVFENRERLIAARHSRLQALLATPGFECNDERLQQAAAWCRLSLDQLIMRQRGLGIYAGFPWFTTYWGRDSFIALPGACLVTGDFETARIILKTFAEHQINDPTSRHEGRLPNFVTVKEVQYATADGTWWWVRALQKYEAISGDLAFTESLYPVVRRALNGALDHRVDEEGFILHGDGETWMDAGGEARPYSPRGNRAVEVQALFANALGYGVELARRLRERGDALRWIEAEALLSRSFKKFFFDASSAEPYDHLDSNDQPDQQIRPNGLLAWFSAPQLFDSRTTRGTIQQVRNRLTFPWGVGSLDPQDQHYHPLHLDLERYDYDEAYHNGDVWLWLSGPLVSGLVALHQLETAWQQTRFLRDELLDRGVVGSLREIRDAADTPGKDEFGGACSQAWSLSEFQRTLYEDYLGVHPVMPSGMLLIEPRLPQALDRLAATVVAGGSRVRIEHLRGVDGLTTRITTQADCEGITARVLHAAPDGSRRGLEIVLAPQQSYEIRSLRDAGSLLLDDKPVDPSRVLESNALPPLEKAPHAFRRPLATDG